MTRLGNTYEEIQFLRSYVNDLMATISNLRATTLIRGSERENAESISRRVRSNNDRDDDSDEVEIRGRAEVKLMPNAPVCMGCSL